MRSGSPHSAFNGDSLLRGSWGRPDSASGGPRGERALLSRCLPPHVDCVSLSAAGAARLVRSSWKASCRSERFQGGAGGARSAPHFYRPPPCPAHPQRFPAFHRPNVPLALGRSMERRRGGCAGRGAVPCCPHARFPLTEASFLIFSPEQFRFIGLGGCANGWYEFRKSGMRNRKSYFLFIISGGPRGQVRGTTSSGFWPHHRSSGPPGWPRHPRGEAW